MKNKEGILSKSELFRFSTYFEDLRLEREEDNFSYEVDINVNVTNFIIIKMSVWRLYRLFGFSLQVSVVVRGRGVCCMVRVVPQMYSQKRNNRHLAGPVMGFESFEKNMEHKSSASHRGSHPSSHLYKDYEISYIQQLSHL